MREMEGDSKRIQQQNEQKVSRKAAQTDSQQGEIDASQQASHSGSRGGYE